ncbi:unnamed protein product [Cuscuta epithymum]|uniref:Uncharacterized protein n=1 Tax=Cuscuta epithymum TaxID=186058 RepID=A0AAV0EVR4_9ASTE|nr:unnamed protein product [Cuscuta epithymum]
MPIFNDSSAGARIFNHHVPVPAAPEKHVPDGEADDDGEEHTAVEGHDGQHQEVSDGGADPEQQASRDSHRRASADANGSEERGVQEIRLISIGAERRSGDLEANTAVLDVLVEDGEEEADEQGERVADPRIGFPEIEQNGDVFAPVERHMHHLAAGDGTGNWW